jgi:hypothetical protein
MPKKGTPRSRANWTDAILPSSRAPEAARHEDAVERLELGRDVGLRVLEQFGVEPGDPDLDAVGHAAVDQRLGERLVGVLEADIFADDADRHLALPVEQAVDDIFPARHGRRRRVVDAEGAQHLGVEPGLVILGGDGVDRLGVEGGMTASLRTLQNKAILARSESGSGCSVRQTRISGWMPRVVELAHAVLGGLGLQLAGGGDVGTEVVWIDRVSPRGRSLRNWRSPR